MKFRVLSGAAVILSMCLAGASMAAEPDAAQLEKGKTLFKSGAVPACAICHTLKDAEAAGTIGPDLDELKPNAQRVKQIMKEGAGAMPSFAATMDEESMDAVAAYVAKVTGAAQ
ncbi:MAG TPA: cytochrome c [Burkholderiaceae bacterium]|nr:cytochrome c [Burkholderiaceae bacterium]